MPYDVQDIIDREYNLEPLECRYCHSLEVTFDQYIKDAYCAECGKWQLGKGPETEEKEVP